jgi:hypothetical protein
MSSLSEMDSCCCQYWEISNVVDNGGDNFSFDIIEETCPLCDCVDGGITVKVYDSLGRYKCDGYVYDCLADVGFFSFVIDVDPGTTLVNGDTIYFDECLDSLSDSESYISSLSESISEIISSLSESLSISSLLSSLSESLSSSISESYSSIFDCCDAVNITAIINNYIEIDQDICDCGYEMYINVYNGSTFLGRWKIDVCRENYLILDSNIHPDATHFVLSGCESLESLSSSLNSSIMSLSSSLSMSDSLSMSLSESLSFSSLLSSLSNSLSGSSLSESLSASLSKSLSESSLSSCISGDEDIFTIVKTACYKYRFDTDDCSSFTITVTDMITGETARNKNGDLLSNYSVSNGGVIEFVHEMAIYKVDILCAGYCSAETKIIYELCDFIKCYKGLIKYIMCTEENPCNESCDKEVRAKKEMYRLEINKMIALLSRLFGMLYTNTVKNYLKDSIYDAEEETFVTEMVQVFDKIKEVVMRCGCTNIITSTTKRTC